MVYLLINSPAPTDLAATSFGGLPVKNVGESLEWPCCTICDLPLQYLGKIATDMGLELIFMCQNDPGMCDENHPEIGGNKVIVIQPSALEIVPAPAIGETTHGPEYGAMIVGIAAKDYDEAREIWVKNEGGIGRNILGQLHGEPAWIQGDETTYCGDCYLPMRFVAQLEQGPNPETEMNFGGGGCAYLFDCACTKTAKFLFQC